MRRNRPDTAILNGERIRKRRMQLGLSQSDVAKRLGITQASVSALESTLPRTSLARVIELARIFDESLEWFVTGREAPGVDLPSIVIELRHYGIWDIDSANPRPPGAFRHVEEVVAIALRDAPNPRIVNGVPAMLLLNDWSPALIAAFAEHHQTSRRVAWLIDVTSAISSQGLPLPVAAMNVVTRCSNAIERMSSVASADLSVEDSLGTVTENRKSLSRIHRRWGITYDQSLEGFRERAAFLLGRVR